MFFLNNNTSKYLNEAPGDEELDATEATENTDEEVEEVEETNTSAATPSAESDIDPMDENESTGDADDDNESMNSPNDDFEDGNDSDEGPPIKGNPYAKKVYLNRFQYLRGLIRRFEELIESQKHLYINSDKDSEEKTNKVNRIKRGLNETEKQLEYLIINGKILSLDLSVLHKLYPKFKTKISIYMEEYSNIFNVKI